MQLLEAELAPESILPEQLDDRPFGGARTQPQKSLQVAVLADALLTFRRWAGVEQPRARRLFADVYLFILQAVNGDRATANTLRKK